MKFTLGSKSLLEKLQLLGSVIPASATLPVISNILFEIAGGRLTITATDLESTLQTWMDVDADGEVRLAIPAKMLIEVLRAFPDQPLKFTVKKNGTIDIHSATGDYSIAFVDADEYPVHPRLDAPATASLSPELLHAAIARTFFAIGTDILRPALCGLLIQFLKDRINFVATDANRLVKYTRTDVTPEAEASFIVPRKPVSIIKSLLTDVTEAVIIEYNDANSVFRIEDFILTCRLIDQKFPNYEAVIPKDNPNKMTVDRLQLLNAVKCVSIFSDKSSHQIRFKIAGNELHLSAQDIDYSSKAEERLSCSAEGNDITIGFNARFVADALSNLSSEMITIDTSLPERAGLLRPSPASDGEEMLTLVMPVRITQ